MTLPWRGNMSVLDDGVVQVPVEALLDIRHILHLSKKLTIRNLKMGGKRNTKCEAKEIQSIRLQKYKILGKIYTSCDSKEVEDRMQMKKKAGGKRITR